MLGRQVPFAGCLPPPNWSMQLVRTSCPDAAALESSLEHLMIATSPRTFKAFAKTFWQICLPALHGVLRFLCCSESALVFPMKGHWSHVCSTMLHYANNQVTCFSRRQTLMLMQLHCQESNATLLLVQRAHPQHIVPKIPLCTLATSWQTWGSRLASVETVDR